VDQIGRRGEKYARPGDAVDTANYELVRAGLTPGSADGDPIFMLVRIASESGMNAFSIVRGMCDRLRADPGISRRLHFLPPRDLAATYRAWCDAKERSSAEGKRAPR
jgi:hypothetical protein